MYSMGYISFFFFPWVWIHDMLDTLFFLANSCFGREQPPTLPVFKSKQAQKRKKKSHRLFYMLGLYIFTFIYLQCSNVTRLHHLKKKKNSKKLGHFNCCASSLVNTNNPHNPFILFFFFEKWLQLIQFSCLWFFFFPHPQVAQALTPCPFITYIFIYIWNSGLLARQLLYWQAFRLEPGLCRPLYPKVGCCLDLSLRVARLELQVSR